MNGITQMFKHHYKDKGITLAFDYVKLLETMAEQIHGENECNNMLAKTFVLGMDASAEFFDKLYNAFEQFIKFPAYHYAVSAFDGAGGAKTHLFNELNEVIDFIKGRAFADNEMFGEHVIYDLVDKKDISQEICDRIIAESKRYAIVGEDGDMRDETDDLVEAYTLATDWINNGYSEFTHIYDRETSETIEEFERPYGSAEIKVVLSVKITTEITKK